MKTQEIAIKNLTGLVKELSFRSPNAPMIDKKTLRDAVFVWTRGIDIEEFLAQDRAAAMHMDHDIEYGDMVDFAVFAGSSNVLTLVAA